MRHCSPEHLSLTAAEQERRVPVLIWFGWEVPVGVQLPTVVVLPLVTPARVLRTAE